MKIITNNKRVFDKYSQEYDVEYIEISYLDLLIKVRNYLHTGYILLSHPLSSSLKPGETPFKSIMIEKGFDNFTSEVFISDAISISTTMINESKVKEYTEKILSDFSLIDLNVITSAIESYN